MSFESQMIDDIESVFFETAEFATEATYTPSGGDAVSITIIKEESDEAIMSGYSPASDSMIFNVMVSEVASPTRGDVFAIDFESWYLVKNISGGAQEGIFTLEVSRSDIRQV